MLDETGIPGGIRLIKKVGKWMSDELIMEERFVMMNLKGTLHTHRPAHILPNANYITAMPVQIRTRKPSDRSAVLKLHI